MASLQPETNITIRVLVSSPGDVDQERRLLQEVVNDINITDRTEKGVRLELWKWEHNAYRSIGDSPQTQIDAQLPDYEVYFGIMAARFGKPTGKYGSGTEKEFRDAFERWKETRWPHILFFFNDSVGGNPDGEQWAKVQAFRRALYDEGLVNTYDGTIGNEAGFFAKASRQLRLLVPKLLDQWNLDPSRNRWRRWYLPLERRGLFTGRRETLQKLREQLAKNGLVAISGLAGVGKTQTAIEYAHRYATEYRAVFWVEAETEVGIRSSFTEIARVLDLPAYHAYNATSDVDVSATTRDAPRQRDATGPGLLPSPTLKKDSLPETLALTNAVLAWCDSHDNWLFIFDNAEEMALVKRFLPKRDKGHILVTSRSALVQELEVAHSIPLNALPSDDALELLLKRTDRQDVAKGDELTAATLLATAELGGLPKAIDHAAAYINNHSMTFRAYLEEYRKRGFPALDPQRPSAQLSEIPIAKTWGLNFECVEEHSTASADLFRFLCMLPPSDIPLKLIRDGAPHLGERIAAASASVDSSGEDDVSNRSSSKRSSAASPRSRSTSSDDYIPAWVFKLLTPLRSYSLIDIDADGTACSIHRLLTKTMRDGMDMETRRLWSNRAISAVDRATLRTDLDDSSSCEPLLPHAEAAIGFAKLERLESEPVVSLMNWVAAYLRRRGRNTQARELLDGALELAERILGPAHPEIAVCLQQLGWLYHDAGWFGDAEMSFRRALQVMETVFGNDDARVADAVDVLAKFYQYRRKYKKAGELFTRALTIREKALEPDELDVADSLRNVAWYLRYRRQFAQAETHLRRAHAIYCNELSPAHPTAAWVLTDLACVYRDDENFADAEATLNEARDVLATAFGADGTWLVYILSDLAWVYLRGGTYEKAQDAFTRALGHAEKVLPPDHRMIADSADNLAWFYFHVAKYADAECCYKRTLALYEKTFGADHPIAVECRHRLARVYEAKEEWGKAESLYVHTLAVTHEISDAVARFVPQLVFPLALLVVTADELWEHTWSIARLSEQRVIAMCGSWVCLSACATLLTQQFSVQGIGAASLLAFCGVYVAYFLAVLVRQFQNRRFPMWLVSRLEEFEYQLARQLFVAGVVVWLIGFVIRSAWLIGTARASLVLDFDVQLLGWLPPAIVLILALLFFAALSIILGTRLTRRRHRREALYRRGVLGKRPE